MKYLSILFAFLFMSCDNRTVMDSGMNDLVVGVQQFAMYDSGEFKLELGLGGVEGLYEIKSDTIFLNYYEKMDNKWPDKILMTKDYFITMPKTVFIDTIKIKRK